MKGKITQTTSGARTKGKTDFKRLREMRDADIDDSDIPKLGKSFWKAAKLTMPEPKDRLTIRLDHDVVEWLKKKGSGYQTRINAILRSYMKAQSDEVTHRRTLGTSRCNQLRHFFIQTKSPHMQRKLGWGTLRVMWQL